jgi:ubiquinone/menaquinone biosynthesis C-methylase UbiE
MGLYLFEPLLKVIRFQTVKNWIPKGGILVDIGCGDSSFILNKTCHYMDFCIGVDENVSPEIIGNVQLVQHDLKKTIPIESDLAHVVTMLASLEHMKFPQAIVQEVYRILQPGGVCLLTVPSPIAKPFLDLFSWLKLVDPHMIEQHHSYFSKKELRDMFSSARFRQISVNYSFFSFHLRLRATK